MIIIEVLTLAGLLIGVGVFIGHLLWRRGTKKKEIA